ncbi:MAG: CocE/NonD family hydrolase [Actinomycetota bacterium]|nr:CocE/NonD family hydrolase [Actinomycetota bacterium]
MTVDSSITGTKLLTGTFAGPVIGLKYETPTANGVTDERGTFSYRAGESVTFLIGRYVLGTTQGAARVNLADLVTRVGGQIAKVADPGATNLARLVQTLDTDGNVEAGVTIAPAVHDLVQSRVFDFDQMFAVGPAEANFAQDPETVGFLADLNAHGGVFSDSTPRTLRSAAAARNELRRNIRGIRKTTDVEVPLRDGSFVSADIFRPVDDGNYPVIMNMGAYGKAFDHGAIGDAAGAEAKEEAEDRYFSGNPQGQQYENHESVNTADWVPNGYVTMRVDGRGVGKSPGLQAPLGRQEAEDYYDAIEWAGVQPWSNGKVGLWGMSYYAISQHNVASLKPPHLAAMIAMGTDADSYNEYVYAGGIFSEGFWTWWWKILTKDNAVGERREVDWMAAAKSQPFNDPKVYGPSATVFMTPQVEDVTTPVWIIAPQSGAAIHQLGSSETFIRSQASRSRKLDFIDAWFPRCYHPTTVAEHMRYFDHWLKGIENGVPTDPPIRIEIRTGNGATYPLVGEQDWPIARTKYVKYYLDAANSDWQGDEHGLRVGKLAPTAPDREDSTSWDAGVELGKAIPAPIGHVGGAPRWSTGVSFVSDPVQQDMVLIGYLKASLWVSSTSSDMDVHVSVRVIDEQDREIRYEAVVLPMDARHIHPVGYGLLKVSHRALDRARSTEFFPVQTHTESEYAPLAKDEVVEIEIGLNPSSALIRKGCRLRVDLQPVVPAGLPSRTFDESYHTGASNTVYTGPDHLSYIQLPLLPSDASDAADPRRASE